MKTTPLQREAASRRLKALLRKIRDGLYRSLESLRQYPAGSKVPDIQVNDGDVKSAALYLRDMELNHDGLRLHGEFARLQNRCMDEWLASMADGESQEYRETLIELFGPFPSQGNPTDSVVADRRVAIVGWLVQLLEFVDELIVSVAGGDGGQADVPADDLQHRLDMAEHSVTGKSKGVFRKLRNMRSHEFRKLATDSQTDDALKKMLQRMEERLAKDHQLGLSINISGSSAMLIDRRAGQK